MEYCPIQIGDDKVRYALVQEGHRTLFVIGLNPSTANAENPDKTMQAVMRFAEYNGYDGFVMCNLYPLRATNPKELPSEIDMDLHRRNLNEISMLLKGKACVDVWLAFGANAMTRYYLMDSFQEIIELFEKHNANLFYIDKTTKNGCPPHPLYKKTGVFKKFSLDAIIAPKEVRDFVSKNKLGSIIKYIHKKGGYNVYSIGTIQDFGPTPHPTGLPIAVVYKEGEDIIVPKGASVFDWL